MTTFETGNREEAIKYKFTLRECLFGDATFYKRVAMVAVPMIVQNTLSNIVGLLDNVMVGQLGTNSLFFTCVYGAPWQEPAYSARSSLERAIWMACVML